VLPSSLQSHQLRFFIVALCVSYLLETGTALGQANSAHPQPSDLHAVERDLEQEREIKATAEQRATAAAQETERVRRDMVAAASRIQNRERILLDLEDQLAILEHRRDALAKTLSQKDKQMREVLMALERLAIRPTDTLMLQPLRPSDAIRSGLVLSAAVPALQENAARLRSDLDDLYSTRQDIIDRRADLAANALTLLEDQAQLEQLYAEKATLQQNLRQKANDAAQRMESLAREARSLRDLLDKVIAERQRQAEEDIDPLILLTPPDGAAPSPEVVIARRPMPPPEARSFAQARGTMPFPVTGRVVQRYGEGTAVDVRSKGIILETRPKAQVVSPFDGVIAYAGVFRGYGRLLILEHSEGYHTLLAGMSRLDGIVGQLILAGEPVGVMAPEGGPSLYVELRRDGQPINPLPWLASQTNETRG